MTLPSIVFLGSDVGASWLLSLSERLPGNPLLHYDQGEPPPRSLYWSTNALCDALLVCRMASANCHHVPCVNLCFSSFFSTQLFVIRKIMYIRSFWVLKTHINMLASTGRSGGRRDVGKTPKAYKQASVQWEYLIHGGGWISSCNIFDCFGG